MSLFFLGVVESGVKTASMEGWMVARKSVDVMSRLWS